MTYIDSDSRVWSLKQGTSVPELEEAKKKGAKISVLPGGADNSPAARFKRIRKIEDKKRKAWKEKSKERAKERKENDFASRVFEVSDKEGISIADAEKLVRADAEKLVRGAKDTTGLNWATAPAEAASQEEPMSDWDKARGQIYAGQRELDTAYGAQREAEKNLAEAQVGQLSEENELADEQDRAYGRQVRALESMQKINRAKLDDYDKGTAELEEDYNNSKIDPNRAFSSTGSKVAAAIAIALGSFAQGMSRGQMPNSALQIIEGAIKRDVDAQKTEMQKNRDVLLNRNNIYARMMARFNNEEVAYKATMALGFKHAGMKMKGLLRKHKGENAQLTINASLAKMDSKQKEFHLGNRKLLAEITVKEAQFQARSGGAQTKRNESMKLAMKTLNLLPNLQRGFESITAMQAAWSVVLPKAAQEMFYGMKEAVTYDDSRNLNAKMLTKAFDGGRPTEKDFQIFVALFPGETADKKIAAAKFNNIRQNLLNMLVDSKSGNLEKGFLTKAWEQHYGENRGLSPQEKAAGKALSDQAKAEEWETRGFKQEGN